MLNASIREEISSLLKQILEETEHFHFRLSELLEQNNRGLPEELETVFRADDTVDDHILKMSSLKSNLLNMAIGNISSSQAHFQWCELPFNDGTSNNPHPVHKGLKCQLDPSHIYCKNHNLAYCPCCGGVLK